MSAARVWLLLALGAVLLATARRVTGMLVPVVGARLSSRFGPRIHPTTGEYKVHEGLDYAAPEGTPVRAADAGRVVVQQWDHPIAGNYLHLLHASGYTTRYLHMAGFAPGIRPNAEIARGQLVGWVGKTGRVTGAHLHFEVRTASNTAVNPEPMVVV